MSKKIEIDVPEDFYEMLEEQAAAEKISLADLVKRELGVMENTLSSEEISARRKVRGQSEGEPIDWAQVIREGRGEI